MVTTRSSHANGETATKRNASESGTSSPARKQRRTTKEDESTSKAGQVKTERDNIKAHRNGKHSNERNQGHDEQQHTNGNKDESTSKLSNDASREQDPNDGKSPTILEKGIIYFFFRGRVGVDEVQSVSEVARSYIVLRPLPFKRKISEGPLSGSEKARLIALPKKNLPKSARDRFVTFVEKANATINDLKENFLPGKEYSTKTQGERKVPPVNPAAEGVYVITSTGRDSHLVYHITVPENVGEVQNDLGIKEQGSFVVTVKNPTIGNTGGGAPNAPANNAEYPEAVIKEFRNLRWAPLRPEMIDYDDAQFLLIGEKHGPDSAFQGGDGEDSKVSKDTFQKLEDEDEHRVDNLKEDDPIFADLHMSAKEYSEIRTDW